MTRRRTEVARRAIDKSNALGVPESPALGPAQQELGYPVDWAHGQGNYNFVPELAGQFGLMRLEKMAKTDETVGSMLWVMNSTVGQIPWFFQPCVNGKKASAGDPDFAEASRYADFAQSCLQDMSHSWEDHLEEALTMAWAGFAPCEIVFKRRDGENSQFADGAWGFDKLPLRDQHTVWDWIPDLEKREIVGLRQQPLYGATVDIPLWKILHYRMSRVLNDPWGQSMLLSAWRPYYLKQRIQESEAIGIDRELCGLPMFRMPMADINAAQEKDSAGAFTPAALAAQKRIRAAEAAVSNLRFNNVGGITLPSDVYLDEEGKPSGVKKYDFEILKSTGQRAIDARTAARDYDRAIARTVLMQFLHLGDRSGGSYAMSEDQSTMAVRSMKWVAGKIAGEFNLKAVKLLWLMNGYPKKFLPKLAHGNLSEDAIQNLGQFIADMAQGEPMFADRPELEDALWERAGIQAPLRHFTPSPPRDPRAPAQVGGPPQLFPGKAPTTPPAQQAEKARLFRAALAKRALQPHVEHTAKAPFPYDPAFLGSIRPDQAPRYFDALTNPERYPLKRVKLADLFATQDRVDPVKVEGMRGGKRPGHSTVVRHQGRDYIADGHHGLTADWLDGKTDALVRYKDLEAVSQQLKGFDSPTPTVGDRVVIDSDRGGIDNAPWSGRVIAADGWKVKVDYDDGARWYTLDPDSLDDTDDTSGPSTWWAFTKSADGELRPKKKKPPFGIRPNLDDADAGLANP